MIVSFNRINSATFYESVINRRVMDAFLAVHRAPTGRDHCPALSISDDMPEAGGGGESAATPEVASDDDDGGDDDGEPARSRPHSKPSPKPGTASAPKKHSGLTQSRIRQQADKIPEIKIAVGEFDLAAAIGMSVDFLRKDRCGKRIIPFFRIGKAIRYNPQRVNEALASLEEGGHKPPKPKAKKSVNALVAG